LPFFFKGADDTDWLPLKLKRIKQAHHFPQPRKCWCLKCNSLKLKFFNVKPLYPSQAGTFESSDLVILIEPLEENQGRKIEIESAVMLQYGNNLKSIVDELLDAYQLTDIHLILKDKGALEPVVRARIETAIKRSLNSQKF
jgi:citrate lyase subunit gamma (acyl carrier protein)